MVRYGNTVTAGVAPQKAAAVVELHAELNGIPDRN
jgi:hypothetical protein